MIIKSLEEMRDLDIGTKLYVVSTPILEIYDTMYTFSTTANPTKFCIMNVIEKISKEEVLYERVDLDRKTAYNFDLEEIYEDILNYPDYHTHKFIIGTDERELIKEFKDSVINFSETIKRANQMVDRFTKDTFDSKLIVDHKKMYPEDWI